MDFKVGQRFKVYGTQCADGTYTIDEIYRGELYVTADKKENRNKHFSASVISDAIGNDVVKMLGGEC